MVIEQHLSNVFFTWDIHYNCNYNCTYCFLRFEPETRNIKAIYSPDKWIGNWENIYQRYGACHISITGGEPFVYPDFMDIISYLSKMHTFEFSTNLSWDINEFMKKVNADRVNINSSFHPEFISIGDFLKRLIILKENKYGVSVTIVGYPPILKQIVEYREKFKEDGFDLIIYPYRGLWQGRQFPGEYSDCEKNILKGLGTSTGMEVNKDLLNTWVDKEKCNHSERLCRMGQKYAKITPNGNAYRCCPAVHKDWGYLGNIIDNTFNLLNEPKICVNHQYCVCYKAMIIGEENKWLKYWNTANTNIAASQENITLDIIKTLRNELKFDEAIKNLNTLLNIKSNSIDALIMLAEVYMDIGDYVSAENTLQIICERNKDSSYLSWFYRCTARLNRELFINGLNSSDLNVRYKKIALSIDYLNKAIEVADENSNEYDKIWAMYEKAYAHYIEKNYPLAKEIVEILLNLEPKNQHFIDLSCNIDRLR